MRPVNADTASRLDCYNDYASGLMAPTSGTNNTFGDAPRDAQYQAAGEAEASSGIQPASCAITFTFSDNQKILEEARLFAQR
jgi:hypothetical protein